MLINYERHTVKEYYRKPVFVPYSDSLTSSLSRRFSNDNKIAFSICFNVLFFCKKTNTFSTKFKDKVRLVNDKHQIENLIEEFTVSFHC